jgi:hypothetical protein
MTNEERQGIENEWRDFGGMDKGAKSMNDLRNDLRNIVGNIKSGVDAARAVTNEIKESDLSAGRTLRDVHGNLVRVEQHLLRPDSSTFEILNLTKRDEYKYSDRNNWGFKIANTPRLDVADMKITMNMALPEQLTEWPTFISSKGSDLHAQSMVVSLTNQTDTIESRGTWGLKNVDKDERGNLLQGDRLVMTEYINGWTVDPTYNAGDQMQSFPPNGTNLTDLSTWSISSKQRLTKAGQQDKFVNLYTEGYGINNDGKILNLNDFTSSSENPFVTLKQVAGELIVFVRESDTAKTDFLKAGNLDLVTTPDLLVAVAEKLAAQAGDLTKK